MENSDLVDYFYRHLNPSLSRLLPCPAEQKVTSKSHPTLRSVLAMSAAESHLILFMWMGSAIERSIFSFCRSQQQPLDMTNFLNELWPDYDMCLSIHCVDSERLIEKLKSSANVSKALSFSNFGSRYEAEQKFMELDELIREIRGNTPEILYGLSVSSAQT